ncbi:MAG: hypothetical protein ACFE91_15520 [Promethearchaeota archaeon]
MDLNSTALNNFFFFFILFFENLISYLGRLNSTTVAFIISFRSFSVSLRFFPIAVLLFCCNSEDRPEHHRQLLLNNLIERTVFIFYRKQILYTIGHYVNN